ncbi:MAG TPA: hypothetical protein VMU40_17165, partial [Steroidobacteraceae bacterium]|nr:hypothetical protein [Steroidobacteraceae bacterium]
MNSKRIPCPQCDRGSNDKAMIETVDERGVRRYCHRCGQTEVQNFERPSAAPSSVRPVTVKEPTEPLSWSAKAEAIWRRTQPLEGTLGAQYLAHRRCMLPP